MSTKNSDLITNNGGHQADPLVIFTIGKGGVGKTVAAQAAVLALSSDHEFVAVDADPSNASLKRLYPAAVLLGGNTNDELLRNLERLIEIDVFQNRKSLVIDTGGGFEREIRSWFQAQHIAEIMEMHSVRVIAINIIDSSPDSASHVLETMDCLKNTHHVILKNLGHISNDIGERSFDELFNDPEFSSYADRASVVTLKRIPDAIEISASGETLHTIASGTTKRNLSPFVISRAKTWIAESSVTLQHAFAGNALQS